jgi:hypothetical protein
MAVAGLAGQLVPATRPVSRDRDNIDNTQSLLAALVGAGGNLSDNNTRAVFLQLDLPFWLNTSLCGLFEQSPKESGTKNPTQQIS